MGYIFFKVAVYLLIVRMWLNRVGHADFAEKQGPTIPYYTFLAKKLGVLFLDCFDSAEHAQCVKFCLSS